MFMSACGKKKEENAIETSVEGESVYDSLTDDTLWLTAYDIDTFNPVFSNSESLTDLTFLMYDPLFSIDENMKATPMLAESYDISSDGMKCTVRLRKDCRFHDGESFGADDVVYTVSQIRQKGLSGRFHNSVLNIRDVYESGDGVVFSLYTPEPLFVNNLTFPIIKKKTAEKIDVPNGTGAYKYVSSTLTRAMYFEVNEDYFADRPEIKNAVITVVPDFENQIYSLKYHKCDIVCLDNDELEKYNTGAKRTLYNNKKLTFMGINAANDFLSFSGARRAISACIDRNSIVSEILFGNAEIAVLPYPKKSYIYPEKYREIKKDVDKAKKELEDAGFVRGDDGVFAIENEDGKKIRAKVEILVNSENEKRVKAAKKISENLASSGISADVVSVNFESYKERIETGMYDLYIGEILLDNSFNTDLLFGPDAAYSLCLTQSLSDAILKKKLSSGEENVINSYSALCDALTNQMPIISLYFKNDAVLLGNDLEVGESVVCENVLSGVSGWKKK